MGGAIGLMAAAGPLRGRIRRLVLNDIGPQIADAAIERIRSYAGSPPAFATVSELEQYFRTVYEPYGWLSDAQWRLLTETSTRRLPDGRVTPHYDPAMVLQFTDHPDDYRAVGRLGHAGAAGAVLRGEHSDLLLPEVAEGMRTRGPRAVVATIPDCGHAPALNTPAQHPLVERFLAGDELAAASTHPPEETRCRSDASPSPSCDTCWPWAWPVPWPARRTPPGPSATSCRRTSRRSRTPRSASR